MDLEMMDVVAEADLGPIGMELEIETTQALSEDESNISSREDVGRIEVLKKGAGIALGETSKQSSSEGVKRKLTPMEVLKIVAGIALEETSKPSFSGGAPQKVDEIKVSKKGAGIALEETSKPSCSGVAERKLTQMEVLKIVAGIALEETSKPSFSGGAPQKVGEMKVSKKGAGIALEETSKRCFSRGVAQEARTQSKTQNTSPPCILIQKRKRLLSEKKKPVKTNAALKATATVPPIPPMVPNHINSRITIYNIPRTIPQEDLAEVIHAGNFRMPLESFKKEFKPIFKTGPITDLEVSWVFEVSPLVRDELLQLGRMTVVTRAHELTGYFRMSRCFKCQKYGHLIISCVGPVACSNCAEYGHSNESCKVPFNPKCVNCKRVALPYDHDVGSKICPSYLKLRRY